MRRIVIDASLKNLAERFSTDIFSNRYKKPLTKLSEFESFLKTEKFDREALYIGNIIKCYLDLLKLLPSQMLDYKKMFDDIIPEAELAKKIVYEDKRKKFYEHIVDIMRYDALREKDFFPYLNALGIKSCVYCNAQLTIVVEESGPEAKALLELDHYHPKSKCPYLCTSIFNLYPTCGNCNRAKSDDYVSFQLYLEEEVENDLELDYFHFKLREEKIVNFLLNRNLEDIDIQLKAISADKERVVDEMNTKFHLQKIYDTQKDIVQELIYAKEVYTDSRRQELVENFKQLFPNREAIDRFIVGTYVSPSDIHKRPLCKFRQDIARYLKLL